MRVPEVLERLNTLKKVIEKELEEIKTVEFNTSNKEEEFLFHALTEIISDYKFACENINYINKPVCLQGQMTVKSGKFHIDGLELKDRDIIEVFHDDYWKKYNIFKFNGEFYGENLKTIIEENDNIIGRIRLTPQEYNRR